MAKVKKMADGGDPMMEDSSEYYVDDMGEEPFIKTTAMADGDPIRYDTSMYRGEPMAMTTAAPTVPAMQKRDKNRPMRAKPIKTPSVRVRGNLPRVKGVKQNVAAKMASMPRFSDMKMKNGGDVVTTKMSTHAPSKKNSSW
jgi:hypothetical protein